MKTNLKRKNYYLDEKKIRRVRTILGARTETEAIDAALNLVVFRREILKSLEKVAGKGGVEKIFGNYSALFEALLLNTKTQRHEGHKESRRTKVIRCRLSLWPSCLCVFVFNHHV